jgi:ABC-type transport system involved in cytochrome c biogenesis permease subunit
MATGSFPATQFRVVPPETMVGHDSAGGLAWRILKAAGSLKITVVMFLAATFLLFIGTLAQDEKNLPEVKAEYFNSWVAHVPWADFFPVTVFGESSLTGWFPFPGGATIGLVLLVNLIAAKMTRFHVAAHGQRLVTGVLVALVGAGLTLAVILTGHRTDGLQGRPPIDYQTVWRLVQAGGLLGAAGLFWGAFVSRQRMVQAILAGTAAVVATVTVLTFVGGETWRMNDPGLRIMWQLIQSSAAALVLLAGLVLVFGARGGNVLIHVAVGLLMLGQFAFGDRQIEERMSLVEGQTTNVAFRTDDTELAIIDTRAPDTDTVTVISDRLLKAREGADPIVIEGLPFDLRVVEYFRNSSVVRVGPVAPNPATTGLGTGWLATARPPEGGASSKSNIASAYIRLEERGTGRDLGTFLVTQFLNDQAQLFMGSEGDQCDTVEADGNPWRLQLRFRREYKPYSVTLDDVRKLDYAASNTPRDYSSYVTFTDSATKAEQKGRIWMNNPVRYRGETFYQSQYSQVDLGGGKVGEMTGLQVVENAGWLIPYVACVLAFWGMLVHFGGTFVRFAGRHERETARDKTAFLHAADVSRSPRRKKAAPAVASTAPTRGWLIPVVALGLVAICTVPAARPRKPAPDAADWAAAGSILVMHEGRVKPLDSVARTTLQLLSNRTSVVMPDDPPAGGPQGRVSATHWLLAHMAATDWADHAPVFRIDALEVLDLFDLTRRQGHRYSAKELERGREALRKQIEAARDIPPEQRTFVQTKYGEINQKLMAYDLIRFAYEAPPMPTPVGEGEEARRSMLDQIGRMMRGAKMLDANHPPAVIPPLDTDAADAGQQPAGSSWQALYPAIVTAIVGRMLDGQEGVPAYRLNPAILPFTDLLATVDGTPQDFNRSLATYRQTIAELPQVRASTAKAAYEAWFNGFNPTDLAKWLYVLATVLCFVSFLAWHGPLNRFISWMLFGIFLLHTFALVSRVYLTGRPPVVNLYSSAVFIGWACVIAGLALESLERFGIGNLVAAASGALTLMVAYGLDTGDTMHVLQAVLDTQFWLSTHVITVTLGYGATFLGGMLGTCAIVHRIWSGWASGRPSGGMARNSADAADRSRRIQDRLYRMTYGVVCFALFFSFIGTVLGGLWADDSWGRFWGWDPKENGALMIVLWNAAVLHARWDRWIGPRGFALFAIGGNIITAWSWFGTNQLGIGLHSYGFTSGVLMLLAGYVVSQIVLIVAGFALTRPTTPSTA